MPFCFSSVIVKSHNVAMSEVTAVPHQVCHDDDDDYDEWWLPQVNAGFRCALCERRM